MSVVHFFIWRLFWRAQTEGDKFRDIGIWFLRVLATAVSVQQTCQWLKIWKIMEVMLLAFPLHTLGWWKAGAIWLLLKLEEIHLFDAITRSSKVIMTRHSQSLLWENPRCPCWTLSPNANRSFWPSESIVLQVVLHCCKKCFIHDRNLSERVSWDTHIVLTNTNPVESNVVINSLVSRFTGLSGLGFIPKLGMKCMGHGEDIDVITRFQK